MGWTKIGKGFFKFLFNQKLAHIFVIGLTIIFSFTNLTSKTKAVTTEERVHNTIIANLIESEFGSLEEDELIEELAEEELSSLSAPTSYLDNLTAVKDKPQAIMQSPDEKEAGEDTMSITQEGSAIIKPDIATTKKTKRPRTKIVFYTVMSGDSVSTIAEEFEVSVNTILWENNLSSYSLIRPGNELTILPTTGIAHKVVRGENLSSISKKYGIEEEKIIEANEIADAGKLTVGEKLIIPGGRKATYTSSAPASYTGLSAIIDLVKPGGTTPAVGNKMNWPTDGHRITQYYSWRHYGVDIANKVGTPIYAADAGVIETIGWSTGYGNTIIIDHGGGKKTRYAHLSKFYVKKGQKVGKGESIGAMGSTGWSTGPHLHFEIIIDGRKYNPLNYIR